MVSQDRPPRHNAEWSFVELVPDVGQRLADTFGMPVYHHRTWMGVGKSMVRERIFHPRERRAELVAQDVAQ